MKEEVPGDIEDKFFSAMITNISDDILMKELRNRELIDETNDKLQKGARIVTVNDNWFDFVNPTPDMIDINDIAHALSHICRYTGHTHKFYSVAQHSVMISRMLPREYALEGLLHDAAETYMGDVNTPLKSLLPKYRAFENKILKVVADKFKLQFPFPDCVNEADHKMYGYERHSKEMSYSKEIDLSNYEEGPKEVWNFLTCKNAFLYQFNMLKRT